MGRCVRSGEWYGVRRFRDVRRFRGSTLTLTLALAAVVASCERPAEDPPQHTRRADESFARTVENEFALLRGADTLAVERYTRVADGIDGEVIDLDSGDRVRYQATTGPDALIRRLEIEAFRAGALSPEHRLTLALEGDSLIADRGNGTGARGGKPPCCLRALSSTSIPRSPCWSRCSGEPGRWAVRAWS